MLGEPTRLTVAGRTDAGVHALGQVASFATERPVPRSLRRALNSLTGPDFAVPAVTEVAEGFDARRDARSRRYRYRLDTAPAPNPFEYRRTLHWPHRFDAELADESARLLRGVHDFTAFTPTDTRHQHFDRTVLDAGWGRESEHVLGFEVEADAFLRGMVRALVGTILEVAAERRTLADFERLLGGASRREAGDSMSPYGLYLLRVSYPDTTAGPPGHS